MDEHLVDLRGERNFHLILAASGYEYPDSVKGVDADWLAGYVKIKRGDGFDVSAHLRVSWRAEELEAFAEEMDQLARTGSGRARLQHMERQVSLSLQPGEMTGHITDGSQIFIEFTKIDISKVDLRAVHRQMRRLTSSFPSRSPL